MTKIAVAMSGGVDSSVAAYLLKKQGHELIGIFLKNGVSSSNEKGCCSAADARDASRVANSIGIPFHSLNYKQKFDKIIDYFIDEYDNGRTPSPCVYCNSWLKFGTLVETIKKLDIQYVATGHYAKIENVNGKNLIKRPKDSNKDQTYFLSSLDKHQIDSAIFPLGDMTKEEVRKIANENNFINANKAESMELCFIDDNYRDFIKNNSKKGVNPGDIVDENENIIGKHNGIQNYTIGQRKGIGINTQSTSYITEIDAPRNLIKIGNFKNLLKKELVGININWFDDVKINDKVKIQVRHRNKPTSGTIAELEPNHVKITFEDTVYAATPGQALAIYNKNNEFLIGGGFIK